MQHARLEKRSNGYFYVKYKDEEGTWRSQSAKTTKENEAKTRLAEFEHDFAELSRSTRVPTIGELIDWYTVQGHRRKLSRSTLRRVARLSEMVGHLRPLLLTDARLESDVFSRMPGRSGTGPSDETKRGCVSLLQAVFNRAVKGTDPEVAAFDKSQCPVLTLAPASEPRTEWLKPAEEADLTRRLLALSPEPGPVSDITLQGLLGLRTGCRGGAAQALEWPRVSFDTRQIDFRVPGKVVSRKRNCKDSPIDDVLLPVLRRAYDEARARAGGKTPTGRVLWTISKSDKTGRVFNDWVSKQTPYPRATTHVLRHTAATRWLRQGRSLWDVANLLADTPDTVRRVYAHFRSADMLEAESELAARRDAALLDRLRAEVRTEILRELAAGATRGASPQSVGATA